MDLLSPWRLVHQVGSAAAAGLVVLGLAACSAVPDELNPVEWISSADSYLTGEEDQTDPELAARADAESAEPVPGSDEPFPKLGQVPDQAPNVTTYNDRQEIAQGLVADRAAGRYVDNPAANAFAKEPALPWREPVAPAPVRTAAAEAAQAAPEPQVTATEPEPEPAPEPMTAPAAGAMSPKAEAAPKPKPMPGPEVAAMEPPPEPMTAPAAGAMEPMAEAAPKPKPKPMPAPEAAAMATASKPMPAPPAAAEPMPARPKAAAELPPPAPVTTATPRLAAPESARTMAALPSTPAPARTQAPTSSAIPIAVETPGPGPGSVHAGVIYFGYGSTRLSQADRDVLARIADMQRARGGSVRVVGHASGRVDDADPVKAKIANFSVAFDRARAVASALVDLGVPQDRVFASSMAAEDPVYSESTRLGEAANRRADIYLDF